MNNNPRPPLKKMESYRDKTRTSSLISKIDTRNGTIRTQPSTTTEKVWRAIGTKPEQVHQYLKLI